VEAGVSVVTLTTPHNWDMHGTAPENVKIGPGLRAAVPPLDRGLCALISDLHERGLGEDVTVVALGEMGRTPKEEGVQGRNHWSYGFVLFAGGGLSTGQTIGDTGPYGERPRGRPYTTKNVLATIYQTLDINPATAEVIDLSGRPRGLLDDPRPIK